MAASNEAIAAALKEMIFQSKPRSQQPQQYEWQRSAVGEPTADALVARSLLGAKPSPFSFSHPITDPKDWDEEFPETHWSLDDETLFYNRKPQTSAQSSGQSRYHFDLNISLPVTLPNSEIRVLNSEGENYYHKPGDIGANILLGCYESDNRKPSDTNEQREEDDRFIVVSPLPDEAKPPFSFCDVWASFLRVHVGTIYNCRADHIREVTELFLATMDSISFDQPIHIKCQGLYTSTPKSRYETRARFITPDDVGQFRVIRRAMKKFVLELRDRYSVHCQGPIFDATISPVCRTGSYLPIEIRRYSALSISGQAAKGKTTLEMNGEEIPLAANCVINEIRLEMTHARTVDPRWEDAWTLCRRMPMGNLLVPGRRVFASYDIKSLPKVYYQFDSPRAKLVKSRFGPLYMLTESALNLQHKENTSYTTQPTSPVKEATTMRAEAVPFFPLNALNQVLQALQEPQQQTTNAWDRLLDSAFRDSGMHLLDALKAGTRTRY